ncbi:MAG: hypothetical protein EON87_13970, partial [Brevundimonas sp.]
MSVSRPRPSPPTPSRPSRLIPTVTPRSPFRRICTWTARTRWAATDLNYLVCARLMIEAAPHIYSQFATHNAHSLAAVYKM